MLLEKNRGLVRNWAPLPVKQGSTNRSERGPGRWRSQNWTASRCSYQSPAVERARSRDDWSGFVSQLQRWCLLAGNSWWRGRPGTSRWTTVALVSAGPRTWGWCHCHSWCTAPGCPGSSPLTLQCRKRQSTIIEITLRDCSHTLIW